MLLAAVERPQPRLGVADAGFDAAHLGCDIDQLRIELAAVLADRGDVGFQLLLQLGGFFLLLAGGFQLLLALLDGVGGGGGRLLGGRCRPARPPAKAQAASGLRTAAATESGTGGHRNCPPRPVVSGYE